MSNFEKMHKLILIYFAVKCRRFGTSALYVTYRNETSILIPLPNILYRNLPNIIKGELTMKLEKKNKIIWNVIKPNQPRVTVIIIRFTTSFSFIDFFFLF